MNEIKTSFIEKAGQFVKRAVPVATRLGMAGGLTLSTASATQVARADSEVGLVPQGITQVMVPLEANRAVVIRTQRLDVAGNHFDVNPENHPDSVIVIGMIANRPVIVPVTAYPNMALGIHYSDIVADSHLQRLAELDRVIQEQVNRSFTAGECGLPTGCNTVEAVGLAVRPLDNGVLAFDAAGDKLLTRGQGIAVAPSVISPESLSVPKYPDDITQAVSSFGGNPNEWSRNDAGAWHFYSPKRVGIITPNGFIMDGYNNNGPFVAGGFIQVGAFGGTIWPVSGPEELDKLLRAVQQNNPGKAVQVIK